MSSVAHTSPTALKGVRLASVAYLCFTVQDALVKWLVADYPVFEVLFVRSLTALLIAAAVGWRQSSLDLRRSRHKTSLLLRAVLNLTAWLLFYGAARTMGLAEVTTIYFVAPVMVVGLSILVLREQVSGDRWLAVAGGFIGVAIAARPSGTVALGPALMTVAAAACWAVSTIMMRMISRSESTVNQMVISNAIFSIACGMALPRIWVMPDPASLALMVAVGIAGALAQFFLFEGFRHAPASLLAPTEYTGFIWAFLIGFAVWGDVPSVQIWLGAALILGSGLMLLWSESRTAR